jgi:hypothetical protein
VTQFEGVRSEAENHPGCGASGEKDRGGRGKLKRGRGRQRNAGFPGRGKFACRNEVGT